jgi:hypothetical protein
MKKALVCVECFDVTWSANHLLLVPYHISPYHVQCRSWWSCMECKPHGQFDGEVKAHS